MNGKILPGRSQPYVWTATAVKKLDSGGLSGAPNTSNSFRHLEAYFQVSRLGTFVALSSLHKPSASGLVAR